MKNKKLTNFLLVCFVIFNFPLLGFGQECEKFLNPKTKSINTKGILKTAGKVVDAALNTNFASLLPETDAKLRMLNEIQYQECVNRQTAAAGQTVRNMVALLVQSGELPPELVKQLVDEGIISKSQVSTSAAATRTTTAQTTPATVPNADDVFVPVLPAPAEEKYVVTNPCSAEATPGFIRGEGIASGASTNKSVIRQRAIMLAREELASNIEIAIKSASQYFIASTETNINEESNHRFEKNIETTVNLIVRRSTVKCAEPVQQGNKVEYFATVEIREDDVLKPVHEGLEQETELQNAVPNYQKFKAATNETLRFREKNNQQKQIKQ